MKPLLRALSTDPAMAMRLPCPICGPRDEAEFSFGGQSHIDRPGPPDTVGAQDWADYLYHHDVPAGWQTERWVHSAGCRQWFNLQRNTVTHETGLSYLMGDAPKPRNAA
jgi:sarcosine oxidase, subunit delta